ncbi:MAG: endo-1,4-beta-xylanase [Acetatifactor sp.]|nr:endo-1,4-beta-xylanase [Acetatifactor sp.]
MKKKLTLLLTGLMVFSLVACGKPEPAPESSDPVVSSTVEESVSEVVESSSESEAEVEVNYSLKDVFAEHGMKIGTCVNETMTKNATAKNIILSQFSSLTMENAMKPDSTLKKGKSVAAGDIVVEFSDEANKLMKFAKENGLALRGHTLVWYSQTPDWIFYENFDTGSKQFVSRDVMLARMESMIKQTFEYIENSGYTDVFYAFDVVNEAWMEDGSMRDNNWKKIIGDDYLWYAFYFADKYAPETIDLYYNDYNEQFKTNALVKFVDTLRDEDGNYLIDGVGFQAHLYTSDNLNDYFRLVDKIAETGLKIQLTELDVQLGKWQAPLLPTDENLQLQGRFTYDLINGLFERVDAGTLNMDSLTFWGVSDSMSWRKEYNPCLYNKSYEPKYEYYGALQIKEKAGY